MNKQSNIPDAQTRFRSVERLRELVKRWDTLILGLEELDARLDEEIQNSPLTAHRKRLAKRLAEREAMDKSS